MSQEPKPSETGLNLDEIAEEFVQRIRQGEHPSIAEYLSAYPNYIEQIEELFPTLAALEKYDPFSEPELRSPSKFDAPTKLGEYFIHREIGRGGMGVVYEAEHETMRRRVALKVLPSTIKKQQYIERFMREARAAGQLHHTNIVPVFEVGESDGVHYYAMQYIHGQNLDVVIDELKNFKDGNGKTEHVAIDSTLDHSNSSVAVTLWKGDQASTLSMPTQPTGPPAKAERKQVAPEGPNHSNANSISNESDSVARRNDSGSSQWSQIGEAGDSYFRRVARVGIQIADALQHAHNHGVLHRDIKPSNLILDTDGVVWVTDFGLAKHDGDNLTHTGDIVGTLRYMAPERFHGEADVRSDVYSLGLTLYELCTLRYAFDQTDRAQLIQQVATHDPVRPRKIRPEIPIDLETVIAKAIAREPSRRYASAYHLAADLQRFVSDRPVHARRVSVFEKVYRWTRRHPARAALISCLVLICAIVSGGSIYLADIQHRHMLDLKQENVRVVEAKNVAESALEDAKRASRASQGHLYWSYLRQAQANQSSGRQGQNIDSLLAVRSAAKAVEKLRLSPTKVEGRHVDLRGAAIAAMTKWDVKSLHTWKANDEWTTAVAVDFVNHRIAQSDVKGNIAVRAFGKQDVQFQLPGPGQPAWIPRFSPDGRYFACRYHHPVTGAQLETVLWNTESRQPIVRLKQIALRGLHCFSADSKWLAVCCSGNRIDVIATESGETVHTLTTELAPRRIQFAEHDSQLIVTYDEVDAIEFWTVSNSPKSIRRVLVDEVVTALDWNDQLKQLSVGTENKLLVWEKDRLDAPPHELPGHQGRVVQIAIHPDGDMLMSSAWDGTTRMHNLVTGQEVLRIDGRRLTYDGFDTSGRQVGFTTQVSEFGIWELPGKRPITSLVSTNESSALKKATFVPKYPELIAYIGNDVIEIWNHQLRKTIATVPTGKTHHFCFNRDATELFSGGDNGVQRWPIQITSAGDDGIQFDCDRPQKIWPKRTVNFAVSEAGQQLAIRLNRTTIQLVDFDSTERIKIGPHRNLSKINYTPDGKWLVSTTWQGEGVKVWNVETGELVKDIAPQASSASIGINPIRNTLTVVSAKRRSEWSMADWTRISEVVRDAPDGWHGDACYSPDGGLLAVTFSRYLPQLIDVQSGRCLTILQSPSQIAVGGIDWSDDGQYLSIAKRQAIQIWDIQAIREQLQDLKIDWNDSPHVSR